MAPQDSDIKIDAEATLGSPTCKFTVSQPVFPSGTLICSSRDMARGSPLLEELFDVAGVSQIQVSGNDITVTKSISDPWPEIGEEIGQAIRDVLETEDELFPEEVIERLQPGDPNLAGDEAKAVQSLLDQEINPGVASHGGHVSLVDVKDHTAYLRLGGGCQGCGMVDVTLKQGIEVRIKEKIPSIIGVMDVTDHAGGNNPYYQPSSK